MEFILNPGHLKFSDFPILLKESTQIKLDPACYAAIQAAEKVVTDIIAQERTVYGINTGFGALAKTKIAASDLTILQQSIVLSHAAGTGDLLNNETVRLILALKINSLARGFSGVKLATIEAFISLYNAHIYPCIPCQGSVGASGDLAPLAHLSALLLGFGEANFQGKIISAHEALNIIGLKPLELAPKEGLALLNGTQVSTALAIMGWLAAQKIFIAALAAGALSVDAARGSDTAFDARIHAVRGHPTQMAVAKIYEDLLEKSEIRASHRNCNKVQDPYCLRCQPQVMGACLAHLLFTRDVFLIEANAVSDNPLIFSEQKEILSGGNFHAEPIAMAADTLAVCIAEIGSMSERRTALLIDPHFSDLPAFLVNNPGVNSGFMLAQVTAAALASENKSLAHPASVDSIPTSANQEDHVSMATFAARRLMQLAANTATIVAIELLEACQGIDFLRPLKSSSKLEAVFQLVRARVAFYDKDRFFAPDIAKIKDLIQSGEISQLLNLSFME